MLLVGLLALTLLKSAFGGFLIDPDLLRLLKSSESNGYYVVSPTHFLPVSLLQKNFLHIPIVPAQTEQKSSGGYSESDSVNLKPPAPPAKPYDAPKGNNFGQREAREHRPFISNRTPRPPSKDDYVPPSQDDNFTPNDDYFQEREPQPPQSLPDARYDPPRTNYNPPKSQYDPPKSDYSSPPRPGGYDSPKAEYGPPKTEYGPPRTEYGPPKQGGHGTPAAVAQQTVIIKSYIEPTYSFGEIPLVGYIESDSSYAGQRKKRLRN